MLSLLEIDISKCNEENYPEGKCASPSEIRDFFKGKFFVVRYGQDYFKFLDYEREIMRKTEEVWLPINIDTQLHYVWEM